jgi:predicted metal-dependent HD superfamily phosphohydrolase
MSKTKKFKALLDEAVNISKDFGFNITSEEIVDCYGQSHRYWHTPQHLYEILEGVKELHKEKKITKKEYSILMIAAIFHDIVYDPKRTDNEEKSVEYMMVRYDVDASHADENINDLNKIQEVILDTETHSSQDPLSKKFNKLDTAILDAQFIEMLDWENKIYKEYKWAGWKQYKKKRIQFLLSSIKGHTHNVLNIKNLIDYIQKKVPKTGICYYEIDKLPTIDKFIENNNKVNNLFDNVIVIIVYKSDNYNKGKIKEYGVCSDYNNEFVALNIDSAVGYISKQSGDITVVKELKYMDEYDKSIDKQLNDKIGNFRVIYI